MCGVGCGSHGAPAPHFPQTLMQLVASSHGRQLPLHTSTYPAIAFTLLPAQEFAAGVDGVRTLFWGKLGLADHGGRPESTTQNRLNSPWCNKQ